MPGISVALPSLLVMPSSASTSSSVTVASSAVPVVGSSVGSADSSWSASTDPWLATALTPAGIVPSTVASNSNVTDPPAGSVNVPSVEKSCVAGADTATTSSEEAAEEASCCAAAGEGARAVASRTAVNVAAPKGGRRVISVGSPEGGRAPRPEVPDSEVVLKLCELYLSTSGEGSRGGRSPPRTRPGSLRRPPSPGLQ